MHSSAKKLKANYNKARHEKLTHGAGTILF